jgi:hypothetical protein
MDSGPQIRPIRHEDANTWLVLRQALWPAQPDDPAAEIEAFFEGLATEPQAVFVAESEAQCIGFMELSIRTNIPGRTGQRVAYVEGLYLVPEYRGSNLAPGCLGQRAVGLAKISAPHSLAIARNGSFSIGAITSSRIPRSGSQMRNTAPNLLTDSLQSSQDFLGPRTLFFGLLALTPGSALRRQIAVAESTPLR